jgi:hypothetical protein
MPAPEQSETPEHLPLTQSLTTLYNLHDQVQQVVDRIQRAPTGRDMPFYDSATVMDATRHLRSTQEALRYDIGSQGRRAYQEQAFPQEELRTSREARLVARAGILAVISEPPNAAEREERRQRLRRELHRLLSGRVALADLGAGYLVNARADASAPIPRGRPVFAVFEPYDGDRNLHFLYDAPTYITGSTKQGEHFLTLDLKQLFPYKPGPMIVPPSPRQS